MAVDLDAIDAALAKMTAGPWPEVNARGEPIVWHEMDGDGWTAIGPVHSDDDDNVTGGPAYIQAARDSLGLRAIRNAAPAMAAEIRTLRADLAAARLDAANAHSVAVEATESLSASAGRDRHVVCERCRTDLHRLTATDAPALTVGAALALPEVQAGTHVVEYRFHGGPWMQLGPRGLRSWPSVRWVTSTTGRLWLDTYALPARVVPIADADRDPSERGAL